VPLSGGTLLAPSTRIMSDAPPPAEEKPKKSALPKIIGAVVGVALIAGIGGGAYWYMHRGTAAKAAAHVPEVEPGIVAFLPFVVNLADPDSSRFLRVTLQLIVHDEKQAEHVLKSPVVLAQARSAILELLTLQTSARLVTTDGKTDLKKAIAERVGTAIENVKVLDVLFSDFVVQL
jgi:flagellar protein FliL